MNSEKLIKSLRHDYRPHTEYDGKVMFSVCLFTGGALTGGGGGGAPGGTSPTGEVEHPRGYPPINLDKHVGQKMDKVLDKHFEKFWRWGAPTVCLLRSRRRTVLLRVNLKFLSVTYVLVALWSDLCLLLKR